MDTGENPTKVGPHRTGGSPELKVVGMPSWKWIPTWTVLTTAALPAALLMMVPLAALLLQVLNLGVKSRYLESYEGQLLYPIGFFISYSLTLATAQWFMLRKYLPHAKSWFVATVAGLSIGGLIATTGLALSDYLNQDIRWGMAALLLLIGGSVGFLQWLVVRRIIPNAVWIIVIDVAAACSLLMAGRSITSLIELVIIPLLPGLITGMGLWILIREAPHETVRQEETGLKLSNWLSSRIGWIVVGVLSLIPLFFLCIWIYATSQIALAKNAGIYPTVEEAVIGKNSRDWGGAKVVRVEDMRVSPNRWDGSQPHVWFGGATIHLDRAPRGYDRTRFSSGSYYIRVEEGWVHMGEGAFPEFVGWVMELYGMEGVNE